jgi:hypothetical protein
MRQTLKSVSYRHDWKGKQHLAEQISEPETTADAVDIVLQAVFAELEDWVSDHQYEKAKVDLPVAALMMNASNRLPIGLRETYLSAEWLRFASQLQRYSLDENLEHSMQ